MHGQNIRAFDNVTGFASIVTRPACSRVLALYFHRSARLIPIHLVDRATVANTCCIDAGTNVATRLDAGVPRSFINFKTRRRFRDVPFVASLSTPFDSTNRLDQVKHAISRILFHETRCSQDRDVALRMYQSSVKSLLHGTLSAVHIRFGTEIFWCALIMTRFVLDTLPCVPFIVKQNLLQIVILENSSNLNIFHFRVL